MSKVLFVVGGVWLGLAVSGGTNAEHVFNTLFIGGLALVVASVIVAVWVWENSDG